MTQRKLRVIVANKGRIADVDFDAVRNAGFSDGEIAEIIAHLTLNVFTNYFNNRAGVEVDFPRIALRQSALPQGVVTSGSSMKLAWPGAW
jgi:hypothetical protein